MDLFELQTNRALEQEGVWTEIAAGTRVKLALPGNARHNAALRKLTKPYRYQINTNTLDNDIAYRIYGEAMAEGIVLDWEGLKYRGDVVLFSKEKAKEFLTNPEFRRFRELIQSALDDADMFRRQEVEEVEKNLPTG